MNLSSKLCEMGEVNYEKCSDEYRSESVVIADGILNEILETAMDMAMKNTPGVESKKMNIIDELSHDEYPENCPEIKNIIDGLSKINITKMTAKPEEPASLDVEMKRLLSEMMSPPHEIINYEGLPRKDGVGDQPMEVNPPPEREHPPKEEYRPSKLVEKKSRITDLVMNSKRVLNNLLDEEERKRQEEFEECNEHLIHVIDLQPKQVGEKEEIPPELVPLPFDDSDELLKGGDEGLDNVELDEGGNGDDVDEQEQSVEAKEEGKKVGHKKRRWSFNLKFFSFRKNRAKAGGNEQ